MIQDTLLAKKQPNYFCPIKWGDYKIPTRITQYGREIS
uniref:Uncharacterized protein n=1 Tax=Anguilla anguilla TaxID=7936 RepID=A0A0E9PEW9_ANGAN